KLMDKKILFTFILVMSLFLVSGCSAITDNFTSDSISGHVVLSNTEIDAEQFDLASFATEKSSTDLEDEEQKNYREDRLVIKFKETDSEAQQSLLANHNLTEVESLESGQVQLVATEEGADLEELINKLETEEVVAYAERNILYSIAAEHPNVSDYNKQWHYSAISLPDAWPNEKAVQEQEEVTVAVVDTGIDDSHPEFGNMDGYNSIEDNSNYTDNNGHGTHVAGTINIANREKVVGVNQNINLLAVKVLGESDTESDTTTNMDISDGIKWAVNQGADVINLSLGGSLPSQLVKEAVNYAHQQGTTVIAASGNDGRSAVSFPARYENTIAVGAIDHNFELANFKQDGKSSSKGLNLDLVAPGKSVYSTVPESSSYSGYDTYSGTSMAAPHVSGVAAMLLANDVVDTPEQLKRQLQETAQDLGAQNSDNQGWDPFYGAGLINAHAALTNAKISKSKVFAGQKDGDVITKSSNFTSVTEDGFYELDATDADYIFAWIDVTGTGEIEPGDYFGMVERDLSTDLELELLDTNYILQ
ncbi:MAG: S8 family serine peptidase, partial [Bacillota bacterium]